MISPLKVTLPPALLLLCFLVLTCGKGVEKGARNEIGVDPRFADRFLASQGAFGDTWSFSAMIPTWRTADIAVLLLTTRSRSFSGLLLSHQDVSLVHPWSKNLSLQGLDLRADVKESVRFSGGYKALPLILRVPVLLYRKDVWERYGLPLPAGIEDFQGALESLKEQTDRPAYLVRNETEPDHLFWSLTWSREAAFERSLYTEVGVQTLRDMRAWELNPERPAGSGKVDFLLGNAASLFLYSDEARVFLLDMEIEEKTEWCGVVPIPCRGDPRAWNAGADLVLLPDSKVSNESLARLYKDHLNEWIWAQGWDGTTGALNRVKSDTVAFAVERTKTPPFLLNPDLREIARGAVLDVLTGATEPEEALRRGEARCREIGCDG